jgi:hypothetical protein
MPGLRSSKYPCQSGISTSVTRTTLFLSKHVNLSPVLPSTCFSWYLPRGFICSSSYIIGIYFTMRDWIHLYILIDIIQDAAWKRKHSLHTIFLKTSSYIICWSKNLSILTWLWSCNKKNGLEKSSMELLAKNMWNIHQLIRWLIKRNDYFDSTTNHVWAVRIMGKPYRILPLGM